MQLLNTIPVALKHYEAELIQTLGTTAGAVDIVRVDTEGLGGSAKVTALLKYVMAARRALRTTESVIVLWPLLGWLDLWLLASRRNPQRTFLIVHDPEPLRPQIGLGRLAASLARLAGRAQPTIICHSELAKADTLKRVPNARVVVLPHPTLSRPAVAKSPPSVAVGDTRIGVFGQFKAARDLELLTSIGVNLHSVRAVGVIRGRGWPKVPGWNVDSRFLSEDELTSSIRGVDVVLIPYSRYYQSGIAIRALEEGTPVIGAAHPFLTALWGEHYPGLVSGGSVDAWLSAIRRVLRREDPAPDRHAPISAQWIQFFASHE
jgi:hypothetical protein